MERFLSIGIMTGNSLDAVDCVLTAFGSDGEIHDIIGHTVPYPPALSQALRAVRDRIAAAGFDLKKVAQEPAFRQTHDAYIDIVAQAVEGLISRAEKAGVARHQIDAIGFHGQTCGHNPPSVAGAQNRAWTIQIGDGRRLADMTGITVIYDFRSDDIMNGGEGAPLAPVHNLHIARDAKARGFYPVAFCNGGNTGNLAVISDSGGAEKVMGWDVGPFNHLIDTLMRAETPDSYDKDGKYGAGGEIHPPLLRVLFNEAAVKQDGANFLLQAPPKSSDPQWYRAPRMLTDKALPFATRLRTAEYFSAYIYTHALSYVPADWKMPRSFLLFGGGWKNPLVLGDFKDLLNKKGLVLPEHQAVFDGIYARLAPSPEVVFSDAKGYSAQYMEARIFADMACCRITGTPFSLPETSGCRVPTVGGVIAYPGGDKERATPALRALLERHQSEHLNRPPPENVCYNRASPGWKKPN